MKPDRGRWIEWVKDLLILLLTLSALYLLSMTPLVRDSGLSGLFQSPPPEGPGVTSVTLTAAALPARLAVGDRESRCGVQYDQAKVDEMFSLLSPLLGEALTSAGEAEPLTETFWRRDLSGRGVYFDFIGDVPLSALGSWLRSGESCPLPGSARRILLCAHGKDGVQLCYQSAEDGKFYACSTALTQTFHLDPAIQSFQPNDALFAFEHGELSGLMDPYTLLTGGTVDGTQYSAADPLLSEEGLSSLLSALSFNPQNHAAVNGGEAYLDGSDRIQIFHDGSVTYRAAQGEKYPVSFVGDEPTVAEAIEGARELAESTVGALCGSARLYLISARPEEEGYLIRFGYLLGGAPVYLYDEGWAAEFTVKGGLITAFTLRCRQYAPTEDRALLPPMERAAVMLPDLTDERLELFLQYRDRGGAYVAPAWTADRAKT